MAWRALRLGGYAVLMMAAAPAPCWDQRKGLAPAAAGISQSLGYAKDLEGGQRRLQTRRLLCRHVRLVQRQRRQQLRSQKLLVDAR